MPDFGCGTPDVKGPTTTMTLLAARPATDAALLAEITDLLRRTGRAHHRAFVSADGSDPDWAIWYAGYLQAHLDDRLGTFLSRGEITYRLIKAEKDHLRFGGGTPWPEFYARILAEG